MLMFSKATHAFLTNVDAREAGFAGADLRFSFMTGSNFDGADFRGSNLSNAYLGSNQSYNKPASLKEANLKGANLHQAKLEGVDLSRVHGLTQAQIDAAIISDTTVLPRELTDRSATSKRSAPDATSLPSSS
jgi:uncharacterized protein YjbI with pentapeptide repeats